MQCLNFTHIINQNDKQIPIEMMNREFNPSGDLEVEFGNDVNASSNAVLEKYSQLALDQLLSDIMLKSDLVCIVIARDKKGVTRVANSGDELPGEPINRWSLSAQSKY